ncbi:MAG: serine protein kinase RIO [Acidilobaceae archaeon]
MRKKARWIKKFKDESRRLKDEDMFEIVEEVFDSITLGFIYRLETKKVIRELKGVVSAGKEARIYWAKGWDGRDLAIKIYLTATSDFKKSIRKYIEGDPRFESIPEGNFRRLIYEWARKEFKNLKRMFDNGVRVPQPITFIGNVLVMSFIGEDGYRAPLLVEAINDLSLDELQNIYYEVVEQVKRIVCNARLIHADLSEYNIMIWDSKPWIIDVSQAVDHSHPRALEFLERDLENIQNFFSQYIEVEPIENLRGEIEHCLLIVK